MFHPPVSSARWQRASVLHRAGLLPSLFNPSAPLISALRGEGEDRGPPGAPAASGGSHPTSDARRRLPLFSRRQKQCGTPTPGDFSVLIRIHRLGASNSKTPRRSVHGGIGVNYLCAGRWLLPPSLVGKTHWGTQKKKRKSPSLPPGPYLMESNLLTSLG